MKSFKYFDNCIAALLFCTGFIFIWHYFKGANYFNFVYAISYLVVCFGMILYGYQVEKVTLKPVKNFFTINVKSLYIFIYSDKAKL